MRGVIPVNMVPFRVHKLANSMLRRELKKIMEKQRENSLNSGTWAYSIRQIIFCGNRAIWLRRKQRILFTLLQLQ